MAEKKSKRNRGTGSLYRRAGSTSWWIAYYVNGKLFRESSGTDVKTKAQMLLTKRLQEVNSGQFNPLSNTITVADVYGHVLADYTKNKRPSINTLKTRWYVEHAGLNRQGSRTTLKSF